MSVKLLFLSGSKRQNSINSLLAKLAAEKATALGAQATLIDPGQYDMPLYDGDLEAEDGMPPAAIDLKALFVEADGFFIASPEYNSAYSPLLKNIIDWLSRSHQDGEAPLSAFRGKVAAISAASPGGLGGLRGLVPLRMLLGNIGVTVIPAQAAIGSAMNAFDATGQLTDAKHDQMIADVVQQLVDTAAALKTV